MDFPVPFINLEFLYFSIYRLLDAVFDPASFYARLSEASVSIFPYATVLSLVFLVGIIYSATRASKIEHNLYGRKESLAVAEAPNLENKRWARIVNHLNSENESDWRLAVLEADLILEDMLKNMGYVGETIGDKLKNIEKSDFNTINEAWEGHRVRNLIAHEGGDFTITNREARRVVALYEKVFKEFHLFGV